LPDLTHDPDYFLTLQTETGWGRTLAGFASWCAPHSGWLALDVGCGPGLLPALFAQAGCFAVGADLTPKMFQPQPLHPTVTTADALALPFPANIFDLITASNLLFLLPDPLPALRQMARALKPGGRLCLLNPSEQMSINAAQTLADQRALEGLARDTLLNFATRAERGHRWSEGELADLMTAAGLTLQESILKMGRGLLRFARGVK
jgi:ubiquinone/menaquinone biosynthesis C-methylase UbiE